MTNTKLLANDIESFPSPNGNFVNPSDLDSSKVSGRIISCLTQLPNQIYKDTKTNNWEVKRLRGNSALYSANYFLNQHTNWENHIVAWTGELYTNNDVINPRHIPNGQKIESDPLYLDENDKEDLTKKIRKANNSEHIHPVWLLRRDQDRWRKYAENVIWPIFHYMQNQPSNGVEESQWWHDYVKFNESYAAKIKSIYKKGDIIWIHDYYLLLLPQILKMELPDCYICSYLHIPFPSSEYFRCLSKRKILLDGMLASNQIGFQCEFFVKHFISCCSRLLGYDVDSKSVYIHSRQCNVISLPIGIDTARIEHDAFSEVIDSKIKSFRRLYGDDKKIIIGRDRLDIVRGVVEKLEAFETFLDMYPAWRDKVILIQVSFKSFYHSSKLDKKVAELISKINGKFGTLNHTPVQYFQMRVERDEYLALLRMADLCLITSIRDGMNTTALEYVVCQKYSKSPLILSEFSGSTTVMPDAININPWDSVGVANSINDALIMSDESKADLEDKLYESVKLNTVQDWCKKFLLDLYKDTIDQSNNGNNESLTPYLNKPVLLQNYNAASHRLFLFDYDGTLTPIVRDPNAAIPSTKLKDVLKKLTQDPKNEIWIISGRDQEFLEKWIGSNYPEIGLSAEHGCFMKQVGKKEWTNLAATVNMDWQIEVEEIFSKYTEKTPGSHIEKKKVALTWHYRKADPELGSYQASKCKEELEATVGKKYDVEVMSGKANLEVRPSFVNKGEIVRRLVRYHDPIKLDGKRTHSEIPSFVLCLGDDTTDEDMFKALNHIGEDLSVCEEEKDTISKGMYPVTVGPANKKTVAKAYLSDPEQVLETLRLLIGDISIFETAGTVELDDRGHMVDSESSQRSELNRQLYNKKKQSGNV